MNVPSEPIRLRVTHLEGATRREVWISAALLCVVSGFMAEVLSSSTPLPKFFLVWWFLAMAYGFPALLIREWAIRRGVSLVGLLIAGFGYGFFNEGLLAKTLFLNKDVPWNLFDGHVGWGGVNWGWLLVICAYHALFSMVTPLLLIEKLRPQTAGQPWLGVRSSIVLFAPLVPVSLFYFSHSPKTIPYGFLLLWGAIAATVLLGSFWRGTWETALYGCKPRNLVWLGAFFLPLLLLCSIAFAHGLAFPFFFVGWSAIVVASGLSALRNGADGLLLLGMGAYAGMEVTVMIGAYPLAKVVGICAFICILWWLRQSGGIFNLHGEENHGGEMVA